MKMFDRAEPNRKSAFIRSKKVEKSYQRQLLKVASHIGDIVARYGGKPERSDAMSAAFERYARAIEPWSRSVAARMVAEIDARDRASWRELGKSLSAGLREELQSPTGAVVNSLIDEQAYLITSMPLNAAKRVQKLAMETMLGGARSDSIIDAIMKTGDVSRSSAKLIARTEVGRATVAFTQARATRIGSEGYIWRTSRKKNVRHSHSMMEGKFVRWDQPPTLDGLTGHAGALPNCHCYPEVVFPDS